MSCEPQFIILIRSISITRKKRERRPEASRVYVATIRHHHGCVQRLRWGGGGILLYQQKGNAVIVFLLGGAFYPWASFLKGGATFFFAASNPSLCWCSSSSSSSSLPSWRRAAMATTQAVAKGSVVSPCGNRAAGFLGRRRGAVAARMSPSAPPTMRIGRKTPFLGGRLAVVPRRSKLVARNLVSSPVQVTTC